MPEVFDVWASATNTELVNRALQSVTESTPRVGQDIAPLVDTSENRVKRSVIEIAALGYAQVVSRYAAPAIFVPEVNYSEEWIELVKMDEMSPIEEDEWDKLVNGNEYQRNMAGASLIQRAKMMQIRYEVKTEIMRWAAFQDALTFSLAESGATPQTIQVKYDQPALNRPDVSDWTNRETSTPITDLEQIQEVPFNAVSAYALDVYMSNHTWKNLKYSKQVKDLLKDSSSGDFFIPSKAQVESLLIGGGDNRENRGNPTSTTIHITEAGYRPESAGYDRSPTGTVKYLPDDYVFAVAGPVIEGEKVAEVLNGRVAIKQSNMAAPEWVQGPANHEFSSMTPPFTHYTRQVCKRIPRINVPEALVYAYAGA